MALLDVFKFQIVVWSWCWGLHVPCRLAVSQHLLVSIALQAVLDVEVVALVLSILDVSNLRLLRCLFIVGVLQLLMAFPSAHPCSNPSFVS